MSVYLGNIADSDETGFMFMLGAARRRRKKLEAEAAAREAAEAEDSDSSDDSDEAEADDDDSEGVGSEGATLIAGGDILGYAGENSDYQELGKLLKVIHMKWHQETDGKPTAGTPPPRETKLAHKRMVARKARQEQARQAHKIADTLPASWYRELRQVRRQIASSRKPTPAVVMPNFSSMFAAYAEAVVPNPETTSGLGSEAAMTLVKLAQVNRIAAVPFAPQHRTLESPYIADTAMGYQVHLATSNGPLVQSIARAAARGSGLSALVSSHGSRHMVVFADKGQTHAFQRWAHRYSRPVERVA